MGEVARELSRLSRDGNEDLGKTDAAASGAVVENPGMEIYGVIRNLLDLADIDLRAAFVKKAALNEGREW